jgi:hypothetical protein
MENPKIEIRNSKQVRMRKIRMNTRSLLSACSRIVIVAIRGAVRTPRPTFAVRVGRGVLTAPRTSLKASTFKVLCCIGFSAMAQNSVLYENNFEKEPIGKVPENFLVLDGGFAVKEEAGNKFLELPGSPLDSYSVQFGPTESSNIVVSARINSTAKGRRFPTFGIGLNGIAGYRLQLSPAKKLLELYKGDTAKTDAPFDWNSGHWLNFRLQIRSTNPGEWKIEGKVWNPESPEPSNWMVSFEEKAEPPTGRPSVFASPFAGTPIQFDDFRVERVAPN